MSGWPKYIGNWKMLHKDGSFHIKVIEFPVPEGTPFSGESMWVKVSPNKGNDFAGQGILDNDPIACVVAKAGDLIEYGGGTESEKPRYIRTIEQLPANKPN